ncbi:MAG: hypothetical protein methR_P3837 [Methyloprofundus sp.]|nr:MAG: hypothetical protein methR_P3837 [Methyloprofundus sp.]
MKKFKLLKLAPLLFASSICNVQAAQIFVDLVPGGGIDSTLTAFTGTSIDVDILIDDVTDFAGFEFDLNFSDPMLNATAVTSGGIFGLDGFELDNQINTSSISFSETSVAAFGLDISLGSPTLLATISFDIVGVGSDPLNANNIVLSDSLGFGIGSVTVINAQLTTENSGVTPAPGVLALMFVGLGFVSLRKNIKSNQ